MNTFMYFLVITLLPLLSIGQQRWTTEFGNPDVDDYPATLTSSYDGGALLCGINMLQESFVYKTDRNGNVLWNKLFVSANFSAMDEDESGDKVIVGNKGANAFIMFLNNCGEMIWCHELINEQHYIQSSFRGVIIENNSIIVLGHFVDSDYNNIMRLLSFNFEGNLLWMNEYLNPKNDPLLGKYFSSHHLQKINGNYFITGFCYYAYPENPDLFFPRAMFVKVDNMYNKVWFLPYGMSDHLDAISEGVIQLDSLKFRGYGRFFIDNTDTLNSIFLDFDASGNEIGHKGIHNNTISSEVKDNDLRALNVINDSTYLITAAVGPIPETVNPMGEWTMDSSGIVYNYQNHPDVNIPLNPTIKTVDNTFMFLGRKQNNTYDILQYKLNADLSQADIDTNTYSFDSLCVDLPIDSDTIFLENCGIITGLNEIPTQDEYYSSVKTIPIEIFPIPATSDITFELGNTELHKNIQLSCFDINGKLVFKQSVQPGRTQIKSNVENLKSGIYIAVTSSSTGESSIVKFIVK
jgi:hypothetical protein